MAIDNSTTGKGVGSRPKEIRARGTQTAVRRDVVRTRDTDAGVGRDARQVAAAPFVLTATDREILRLLATDARMPNNALAAAVGIAPSTCLTRMRLLREAGVIRGYFTDIDQTVLGQGLQALISVRWQSGSRERIATFVDRIKGRPAVQRVFFLAGANDFMVHVAVADAQTLRDFVVEELSAHPEVALTETNLIFEHQRGLHATSL